jgi:hypothetical protein
VFYLTFKSIDLAEFDLLQIFLEVHQQEEEMAGSA